MVEAQVQDLKAKLERKGSRISQEPGLLVRSPTREVWQEWEWWLCDRTRCWYALRVDNPRERFLATVNWVLEYQSVSDLEFGPQGLELMLTIWREILKNREANKAA